MVCLAQILVLKKSNIYAKLTPVLVRKQNIRTKENIGHRTYTQSPGPYGPSITPLIYNISCSSRSKRQLPYPYQEKASSMKSMVP